MFKNTSIIVTFLLLFCLVHSSLQAQFTLTGEIRPRSEFRNGFKSLRSEGEDPAFFVEQRSRLYFNYKQEKYELQFTLQDVRIWGSVNQIYKSDPALTNVYEAWARYYFSESWSMKLGRQALDYNNARFLGNLDWAQQGRSHDALLFLYENAPANMKIHIGGAYNQSVFEPTKLAGTAYFGVNNYKTMQFVWYDNYFDNGRISMLIHNDGRQVATDTSMAYRQTYGLIGDVKLGSVKLGGEFYYQGGKNQNDVDVSAYLIALNATFNTSVTPLIVGMDFLSGTDIVVDEKDRAFAPLYGTNHKFYGFMDYFYVGNNHGQLGATAGLRDVYFKANFKLGEKSNLKTDLHYFSSDANVYESVISTDSRSRYLGTELDLVYVLGLGENAKFHLGYSQLFASESMEFLKGGDSDLGQQWAWAMISFKPQLFSTRTEE